MRTSSRLLAAAALLLTTPLVAAPTAVSAAPDARDRFAPAASATIHPGVQMFTKGAQCTGNFVFTDRRDRVYVGYAAHCAGKGEATDTNGCNTPSVPLGTKVRFASGATLVSGGETVGRGKLAYSSWRAMQRTGAGNANACASNDFALVRVVRRHVDKVNPSVPEFGGPTGLADAPRDAGEQVYSWGQSSLRPGTLLSPKYGTVVMPTNGKWGTEVYTVTRASPGTPAADS